MSEVGSHNPQAEQAVLGGILRWPSALVEAQAALEPEDFYLPDHQAVFRAMVRLGDNNRPIDLVTVISAIQEAGEERDVRSALVGDLYASTATGANVPYYAEIVRAHAARRRVVQAANAILAEASAPGETSRLLDYAEREMLAATAARRHDSGGTLADAVNEAMDTIDRRANGEDVGAIPTGLRELDELTLGLHPGELVVLAARPSIGKTTVATTILANVLRLGRKAYFASLEQPKREIATRMLIAEGRLDARNVRAGELTPKDIVAAGVAADALRRWGLYVSDSSYQTALTISSNARRYNHRNPLALVVVDYLQFLAPSENNRASKNEQVGASAKRLKQLARDLRVPVLCLAQLNRQVDGRGDGRPRLSDLRDSGEIEQHADLVILLNRLDMTDMRIVDVEFNVAKNRNGPTGSCMIQHVRAEMRFEDKPSTKAFGE